MSNSKQSSQHKRKEEFMLTELNNVLSVRAEQIRQRLLDERQAGTYSAVAVKDDTTVDTNQVERPVLVNPVSQARLKRRQKVRALSKVANQTVNQPSDKKVISDGFSKQLKGGSTVDIRNYRPGYTWSRGGRVKELRIRCIARKYLLLWLMKTFGRVSPSVARHHYNTSLLHKYFYIWHNLWWEIVKEWRLGVRAECHYRYKVGLKIFLSWKKFIVLRCESKARFSRAMKHYDQIIVLKTLKEWTKYVHHKHGQSSLKKKADNFWQMHLIRKTWAVWMHRHNTVKRQQEYHSLALQFWADRVQAQYWLLWKSALEKRRCQQERYCDAGVYYNSVLASKCLKAWTLYISNRRVKKARMEFASRVHCFTLKLHVFNHWCQRWHLLRSLQRHQMKIDSLSFTFRHRWVLWRWKNYVTICKEIKNKEAIADHHCNLQLLRIGLDAFGLNVVQSHITTVRNQLAQQLRQKQLHRWVWMTWLSLLERKEEARLESRTKCARDYYNTKIMKQSFLTLVNYARWRRHHKSQYAKADAHFYLVLMPKCLFQLRLFLELEKTCRENAARAKEFRKNKTLQRTFHFWYKASTQSKDERMMIRMALLHRESILMQSAFILWRERTKEALNEEDRISQAVDYYMLSICRKAWQAWRDFIMQKRSCALNIMKATHHNYLRLLKSRLQLWRKWVQHKKERKAQKKKAMTHHKSKILRACVSEWKSRTLQGRQFKSVADVKYKENCTKLLCKAFAEWHTAVKYLAIKKKKKIAASIQYNRTVIHRVMREWHHYAVVKSYSRVQTNHLLSGATRHLQQLKLSLYFRRWKEEKIATIGTYQQLEMAVGHNHRCIVKKVMEAWKIYCSICLRKKLLARQCQWFHDVRLSAKYFLIWNERLVEHGEEKKKSHLALWHWSLMLQQKVLQAWKSYLEIRKHKKSRMIKATESYRQRLLREACCQWLVTADSLSQIRAAMAARHQATAAFERFQLIQRCTLHWKAWARKRSATKGQQNKREIALTLTSAVRLNKNVSAFPLVNQTYLNQLQLHGDNFASLKPQQAVSSPLRPFHHTSKQDYNSLPNIGCKRPPPKRPAFLVDSLKRAGLYSVVHDFNNSRDQILPSDHIASNQHGAFVTPVMSESTSAIRPYKEMVHNLPTSDMDVSKDLITSNTPQVKAPNNQMSSLSEKGDNSLEKVTALMRVNYEQKRWVENDKAQSMISPRIPIIDQQQQADETSSLVQEEPFVLLKPEDFMKKPTVQVNQISMTRPLSAEASCGVKNVMKHSHQTLDNNGIDQSLSSVKDQDSTFDFHEDNVASMYRKPEKSSLHQSALQGTLYKRYSDNYDNLASLSHKNIQEKTVFVIPQALTSEEEIIQIRDMLKVFTHQKQKLRSLHKQYQQLSNWLVEAAHEDEDTENVKRELDVMKFEMTELQAFVNSQKPVCERFIKRAHMLAQELQKLPA